MNIYCILLVVVLLESLDIKIFVLSLASNCHILSLGAPSKNLKASSLILEKS